MSRPAQFGSAKEARKAAPAEEGPTSREVQPQPPTRSQPQAAAPKDVSRASRPSRPQRSRCSTAAAREGRGGRLDAIDRRDLGIHRDGDHRFRLGRHTAGRRARRPATTTSLSSSKARRRRSSRAGKATWRGSGSIRHRRPSRACRATTPSPPRARSRRSPTPTSSSSNAIGLDNVRAHAGRQDRHRALAAGAQGLPGRRGAAQGEGGALSQRRTRRGLRRPQPVPQLRRAAAERSGRTT